MRLLVLALIALSFAQPSLAREHYRHRHIAYVHSYHHTAHLQARRHAWQGDGWHHGERAARVGIAERGRAWSAPMSDRAGTFERGEAHGQLDAMIARHAQQNGLPEALVHRVVIRESRYQPGVVGAGGAMGLMQIKLGTAREMGYGGTAAGLLDPETNLTYAVRYLAGAYRVAGGNADRAVANYARGYRDTSVREGAAPRRQLASFENPGWSDSYARAQPSDGMAQVRAPLRHRARDEPMRAH